LRFHMVRVDEETARMVSEAMRLVDAISRMLSTEFELSLRTGRLEEQLTRLGDILERLLTHGVTLVETALERARLLASYAHALRVRLSSRPRPESLYLSREYGDFVRHLAYVRDVLSQLRAIVSRLEQVSQSEASASDRSPSRPEV
jgi:hypothetical protein